jgi:magnesium transporter
MSETIALREALDASDISAVSAWLEERAHYEIAEELTRLDAVESALVWRLLQRDLALEVFEELDAVNQQQILSGMRDHAFRELLERMDPDDRVRLLGEAPATFVQLVLAGLSPRERSMTAELLGYPEDSVGRVMTPEVVTIPDTTPVPKILEIVRRKGKQAETVAVMAVVDRGRRFVGMLDLAHVVLADESLTAADIADVDAETLAATDEAEAAARLVQDANRLGLMVLDTEGRVIGMLTVDDAIDIIEDADSEDIARQAASLPSTAHYLSDSVFGLAKLRVVWLVILMLAATVTVAVLQVFEDSLEEVTALALFIPLLMGTGGNVGAQAATSAVRAIALGEVRPQDVVRVAWRESRVGLLLGLALGTIGFGAAYVAAGPLVAITVGASVAAICVWATTVGSVMPLAARAIGVDPAVISAPLVMTMVDATGLLIYFVLAVVILGI